MKLSLLTNGATGLFIALIFYKVICLFADWSNPFQFSNSFDALLFASYLAFSTLTGARVGENK